MDPISVPPPPPPPVSAAAEPAVNSNEDNKNNNPSHPPYEEMIYTAIGALKEREGSSKRAIGKYIEQVYKEQLPPTHAALLTHHLNRMKNSGLLVMVKKSYKLPHSLPGSDSSAAPALVQGPARPRGRPPKPKSQPHPTEPVWAALGLSDAQVAVRKGRGRPKKIITAVPMGPNIPVRRGRPPGSRRSKLPKRPGRPPKPKSVSAISNGLKRRPGRPPKVHSSVTVIPFAAPLGAQPPVTVAAPVPNASPRPRGRPRKNSAAAAVGGAALAAVLGAARGRGRPQKLAVGRPKNPAVRPVGRPKGSTSAAITAQKAANEDLKKKLEHFQSKVKESLGVLKPYFNHESPVTAIAAIQDLEILATLDLKAPLRDETQQLQQLPAQQLPAQPQVFEQQYPEAPPQPQLQQFFQPQTSAPS